jgi:GTPase Era involved in 16S rRNA processing
MMGQSGSGISATGNSILGKRLFDSSVNSQSITRNIERGEAVRFNHKLTVIDTPGFSNTYLKDNVILEKIMDYSGPGYNAILIVLDISRFTENEKFIEILKLNLSSNFEKHSIIIFTHKDRLDKVQPEKSIIKVVASFESQTGVKQLIRKVGHRYVDFQHFQSFVDNNDLDEKVQTVLDIINTLPKERFYFNSTVEEVHSDISSSSAFMHFRIEKLHFSIDWYDVARFLFIQFLVLYLFYIIIKRIIWDMII